MVLLPITTLAATDNIAGENQDTDLEQILVKFKAGTNAAEIAQIHRLLNSRVMEIIPSIGVQVVAVPGAQAAEKIKNYKARPEVQYAENDSLASVADVTDDTYFSKQWNLSKVQAPKEPGVSRTEVAMSISPSSIPVSICPTRTSSTKYQRASILPPVPAPETSTVTVRMLPA